MSTNGIIARSTGEGTFEGRYHHWDSYPHGLGVALVELYRGHFKHDLSRMLQVLLDKHPAGWSTIVHTDFKLKPGFTNVAQRTEGMSIDQFQNQPLNRRPHCYCHGHRHEECFLHNEKSDCGAQWAYVFQVLPERDGEPEQRILHVLNRQNHNDSEEYFWNEAGCIDLDSTDEINWTVIECGENFERCPHTATYHGINSPLSMQTFLGISPLELNDAVAFIVKGNRYKSTGCGGDADFVSRGTARFPSGTWVQTVIAGNGKRLNIPVAGRTKDGGFVPLAGVQWVMPGTKNEPRETIMETKSSDTKLIPVDEVIAELRRKFPGRVTVVSYEGLKFAIQSGIDVWEHWRTDSFQDVIRDIGCPEQKERLKNLIAADTGNR
jgi:hypothetical protein